MRHRDLLKRGTAVLLSFSLSLGLCAQSYAITGPETELEAEEEAEIPVETGMPAEGSTVAATSSDADSENGSGETSSASSSDAQYDEDGFLLDGRVLDDQTKQELPQDEGLLPEEAALLNGAELLAPAQGQQETFEVTLDYGVEPVWEKNGKYFAIGPSSVGNGISSFNDRTSAEDWAEQTFTFSVNKGESLAGSGAEAIAWTDWPVETDGTPKMMTGWSCSDGTETDFMEILEYVPEEDVTFTAVWSEDLCKVVFDYGLTPAWESNGVYYAVKSTDYQTVTETFPTLAEAEENAEQRAEYYTPSGLRLGKDVPYPGGKVTIGGITRRLEEWKGDNGETLDPDGTFRYTPSENVVFTAEWDSERIITLHENNGAGEDEKIYKALLVDGDVFWPQIGPNGAHQYGFENGKQLIYGWSTDPQAVLAEPERISVNPEGNLDLYAVWGKGVKITLDTDGGTMAYGESEQIVLPETTLYLHNAKKDGYIFKEWKDKATGKAILNGTLIAENDQELIAVYLKAVNITYVENFQGSTTSWTKQVTEGVETKLEGGNYVREKEGYILAGFSADKNAVRPEYLYGDYETFHEDQTLYYVWVPKNTLTVNLNGGCYYYELSPNWREEEDFELALTGGENILAELEKWIDSGKGEKIILEKDNCVLSGWSYDAAGMQPVNDTDVITKNTVVYANWTEGYQVTIDYGGDGVYGYDVWDCGEDPSEWKSVLTIPVRKGEALSKRRVYYVSDTPLTMKGYMVEGEFLESLEGFTPTKDTFIQAVVKRDDLVKLTFHGAPYCEVEIDKTRGEAFYSYEDPENYEGFLAHLYAERGCGLNTAVQRIPELYYIEEAHKRLFTGWTTEEGGSEKVDFSTETFDRDIDLYPVFGDDVKVEFVLYPGSERYVSYSIPQNAAYYRGSSRLVAMYEPGSDLTYPKDEDMECGDLVFQGWYKNEDFTGDPIFIPSSGAKAEDGMVLYAKWGTKIPVTGVTLDRTSNTITAGSSFTLTAAVQPEDATNKLVTWISSDPGIATVTETGKVTGVKAGTATITVKTADGSKTASCAVTVQAAADPVEVFVKRLYTTCLGREADAGGLKHWTGLVKNGTEKGIKLAGDFVFSKEFTNKNYCNEHFVRQLYLALMGRDPAADPDGVKYWTGVLDKGTTREALLNKFTSTSEYKKLCADAGIELGNTISDTTYKGKEGVGTKPYGPCAVCGEKTKVVQFAERMYTECLGRAAEAAGLAYWSKGLYEKSITGQAILNNFFLGSEIKNKNLSNQEYVRRIYKVMLDRSPDSGGLNYWAGRLDKGDSPAVVIAGFIDSKEFTKICSDYGIKRK